ncbi:MAG: hypothetical protein ACYC5Y_01060 [Symbiobacteriia bacterium]
MNAKKRELNLNDEVKWQKVTSQYLDKYRSLIDLFFDFIERDMVKVWVMFTQNYYRPHGRATREFWASCRTQEQKASGLRATSWDWPLAPNSGERPFHQQGRYRRSRFT